jgi:hypothetical protein
VQAHRFGEQDSTIEIRQGCAFPRPWLRPRSVPQRSIRRILNLVAAEALSGADRLGYIDFV